MENKVNEIDFGGIEGLSGGNDRSFSHAGIYRRVKTGEDVLVAGE